MTDDIVAALDDALISLGKAEQALLEADALTEATEDDLVDLRGRCAVLRDSLLGATASVDAALIAALGATGSHFVAGVGQAVVGVSRPAKVRGAALARHLAARVVDHHGYDRETGEKLPPSLLGQMVAEELAAVFALDTSSTTVRKGELKARDIPVGEFMEWAEQGRSYIRWVGGAR